MSSSVPVCLMYAVFADICAALRCCWTITVFIAAFRGVMCFMTACGKVMSAVIWICLFMMEKNTVNRDFH